MSEQLLSMADQLRNAALAKKAKSGSQVKSETILNKVVQFLNQSEMDYVEVSSVFSGNKPANQIVQRFRNVIIENKLDELVWPVENDGTVYLTILVERDEQEDDN